MDGVLVVLRPEDHPAVAQEVAEAVAPYQGGSLRFFEDVRGAVRAHDVQPAFEFELLAVVVVEDQNVVCEEEAVSFHAVSDLHSVKVELLDAQLPVASRHNPFAHGIRDLEI